MKDVSELAEFVLKKAEKMGFDEVEVYVQRRKETFLQTVGGLVTVKGGEEIGIGIRGAIGKKVGFVSVASANEEVIEKALKELSSITRSRPEDKDFEGFADPGKPVHEGGLVDEKVEELELSEIVADVSQRLEEAKKGRIVKVEYYLVLVSREDAVLNSRGAFGRNRGTYVMAYSDMKAKEGDAEAVGMGKYESRRFSMDGVLQVIDDGVALAEEFLSAKKLPEPFKGELVIDAKEVPAFFEYFFTFALSALNVQEGRSRFAGKLGEQVASEKFTVLDDPTVEEAFGSVVFDGEGVPTRRKDVISRGVLRTFLYDTYTARREGKESTGNGMRSGYNSQPAPAPTNLVVVSNSGKSAEDLIGEVDRGVYVKAYVMGSHMADLVGGGFSLTSLNAYYVENGEVRFPIKSVTISGNFFDLIKGIKEVGGDPVVVGSWRTPSILASGLSFI